MPAIDEVWLARLDALLAAIAADTATLRALEQGDERRAVSALREDRYDQLAAHLRAARGAR